MESRKVFLEFWIIICLLFFSCSSKDFKFQEIIYYPDGSVKGERYWNIEMEDEFSVLFSELGDTTELRRILGSNMAVAQFEEDTTYVIYYIQGNDSVWYGNEFLTFVNNDIIPLKSNFIYIEKNDKETRFSHIGGELDYFALVLFGLGDDFLSSGDTIRSFNDKVIVLENSQLNGKKVFALTPTKVSRGKDEYSRILTIGINPGKEELQDFFNLILGNFNKKVLINEH